MWLSTIFYRIKHWILEKRFQGEYFRKIGGCIYCGATENLTNEHIFPYGLFRSSFHDSYVLGAATCTDCQKITSKIENEICAKNLADYRHISGYRSRSKYENYPKKRVVTVRKNGKEVRAEIDIHDLGWIIALPVYSVPETGLISKNRIINFKIISQVNTVALKKYGIDEILVKADINTTALARLLAKIAYGFAVLRYGYSKVQCSPLRDIVLGKKEIDPRLFASPAQSSFEIRDPAGIKIYEVKSKDGSGLVSTFCIEMKILSGDIPIYNLFLW